jgi:D-3-phosphoglycerate dehydrogenase
MKMYSVWVAEKSYRDYSIEKRIVETAGATLKFAQCRSEDDIIRYCGDAHAILLRQTRMGEHAFRHLRSLKVVARYGVGYDNVDIHAATAHGVAVTIVPDYCVSEVADHAIALLLSAIRKIPLRDRSVRSGHWDAGSDLPVHRTLGKTFGLMGYGKTAREVRKRLSGFPFRFIACDPWAPEGAFENDHTVRVDFHTLISLSHYISIHLPLTPETFHLFDMSVFQKMRTSALIVNTSRGQIVETESLCTSLREGLIAGAALDVYESEPLPEQSALRDIDSVILSDHAAWYSEESQEELQMRTALEAVRVLRGEKPHNIVNPDVLDTRDAVRFYFPRSSSISARYCKRSC